jgi:hydrogenase nickel incorporation protein HypA/HybF
VHELSIAQSILDIVHAHVPSEELTRVRSVKLKVGELAGVVTDSLEFCFTALVHETDLAASSLLIEHVPYTIHCNSCNVTMHATPGFTPCPNCGGSDTHMTAGAELQVMEIELHEDGQDVP